MLVNVMSVVDTVTSTVRPTLRPIKLPSAHDKLSSRECCSQTKRPLCKLIYFSAHVLVSIQVPLPVMIMMDTIRRGELPDGVAVLQVMPCTETVAPAGQRIFSLWEGPDVEAVSSAVESTIGDTCTSTLFPVMEDHSHGISKETLDEKLERVARNTGRKIRALDDKLGVSEGVTAATAVTVAVRGVEKSPRWGGGGNGW